MKNSATRDCGKCDGTGTYLHFGTCYACNGTGTAKPVRSPKPTAWWARECICFRKDVPEIICHLHSYAEWAAARSGEGAF